jgi:hypothetical protein
MSLDFSYAFAVLEFFTLSINREPKILVFRGTSDLCTNPNTSFLSRLLISLHCDSTNEGFGGSVFFLLLPLVLIFFVSILGSSL